MPLEEFIPQAMQELSAASEKAAVWIRQDRAVAGGELDGSSRAIFAGLNHE